MAKKEKDNRIWVYVEFAFDSRVAHFYGRMEPDMFDRLLRREVKEMVPLDSPYWYSEEDSLLSSHDYQGANAMYFDPGRMVFLAKVDAASRVMKDIEIAQTMGEMGLHQAGNN